MLNNIGRFPFSDSLHVPRKIMRFQGYSTSYLSGGTEIHTYVHVTSCLEGLSTGEKGTGYSGARRTGQLDRSGEWFSSLVSN